MSLEFGSTQPSFPTRHTYYIDSNRAIRIPPTEDEYLIETADSVATSLGESRPFFRFSEYAPIEPNLGLVRK